MWREVADELDLGHVVGVDLGRHRVDADDAPVARRGSRPTAPTRPCRSPRRRRGRRARRSRPGSSARSGPAVNRKCSSSASSTPLPMKVVITCRPVCRQSSRSAGDAPWRTTPWPTSSTGRRASRMSAAAALQGLVVGLAHRLRRALQAAARPRPALAMTSAGSSRCVAPGFSAVATEKALRTASAHRARVVDPGVPLGHRLHHLDGVDELVGLLVHAGQVDLAGDRHQRGVVQVGVGDAGGQVGRARTQRGQAHAGLAGEAPVGFGHEGGALLVAGRARR